VRISVFGIDGGLVRTLVDRPVAAGFKTFTWDGSDDTGNRVSSGVYFYRLEVEGETITKKMVLLK
jgi:flagellar hook assembly protein FlgD